MLRGARRPSTAEPPRNAMNPRRLPIALSLAALLAGSGVARAEPPSDSAKTEAATHFARALGLVDKRRLQEAVVEFQRAYALRPHYSVLYNIAVAYIGLGKPVEAVDALERTLTEGSSEISPARLRWRSYPVNSDVHTPRTRQPTCFRRANHGRECHVLLARSSDSRAAPASCRRN